VKFKKPFLGITPKPFYPINIDLPVRKPNTLVYPLMLKSIYYQTIISLELIRVYNAPPLNLPYRFLKQSLTARINSVKGTFKPESYTIFSYVPFLPTSVAFKEASFLLPIFWCPQKGQRFCFLFGRGNLEEFY
jgi:hypothetical protein